MINNVVLLGRFTADPELRKTPSDKSVCTFSIACERDFKFNNQKVVDYITCTAWNTTAEFVSKYFSKGSMIGITGNLYSRTFDTKEGHKRTVMEVNVLNVYFCESKKKSAADAVSERIENMFPGDDEPEAPKELGMDLPF